MRRRLSRYHSSSPQQNLDSFLDIMTNTVGVLMFIGLFMTLVTVESANIIRTPLSRPTKKEARLYELSGDRLHYVDIPLVQEKITQQFNQVPMCKEPKKPSGTNASLYDNYLRQLDLYQRCAFNQGEQLQRLTVETQDYQVSVVNFENLAVQYDLKQGETVGEDSQTLFNRTSNFQQQLAAFDPRREYLAFLVRPDSFDSFRQVREIAWKQGFDVGWEPLAAETPIVLGNEGRSINVQ